MADKCASVINFLIRDYLENYSDILGITVGITNIYPEQADNQVRNAMTHLSRAANTNSEELIAEEIKKAKPILRELKEIV